jgi:hypothetical protein
LGAESLSWLKTGQPDQSLGIKGKRIPEAIPWPIFEGKKSPPVILPPVGQGDELGILFEKIVLLCALQEALYQIRQRFVLLTWDLQRT